MESMINMLRVVKEGMTWKIYGLCYGAVFGDRREEAYLGKITHSNVYDNIYFEQSALLHAIKFSTMKKLPIIMRDYNYEVLGRIER